jgi:hypothetical protein
MHNLPAHHVNPKHTYAVLVHTANLGLAHLALLWVGTPTVTKVRNTQHGTLYRVAGSVGHITVGNAVSATVRVYVPHALHLYPRFTRVNVA